VRRIEQIAMGSLSLARLIARPCRFLLQVTSGRFGNCRVGSGSVGDALRRGSIDDEFTQLSIQISFMDRVKRGRCGQQERGQQ
jgi:hypothetical protein